MRYIIFVIQLVLIYIMSLYFGMAGNSIFIKIWFALMIFGLISTGMWDWKLRKKQNYKIWSYISIILTLLYILTPSVMKILNF